MTNTIFTKGIKYIVTPLIWNLPLFLVSILMLGGFDMLYYQHLYHEYETSEILSGYAEMIFMSYLICLICCLFRSIHHLYRQFLSQVLFRNRHLTQDSLAGV